MKTQTRRRLHLSAAVVFAVAYFFLLALNIWWPAIFEVVWKQVLLFVSFYAISATHIAGASAETPTEED